MRNGFDAIPNLPHPEVRPKEASKDATTAVQPDQPLSIGRLSSIAHSDIEAS
jgi:hypothetical protein